ncbi:MAG: hypothetical protein JSV94_01090 [Methanobacteriota archaeon]|nr:MAG: hypothetical protein JSV94_01090 [Euryarchaeota archaeon]
MKLLDTIARLQEKAGKLNSKTGRILGVLILCMLMASASATVFVNYYGDATATVRTPDIQLVAGSDSGGSGYPSATVTVASTFDSASIAIDMFPSVTSSPQPATYYTDLLQIDNPSATARTINSVTISGITDTNSVLGNITVYYCTSQTDDPASSNVGVFYITSTTGGSVLGSSQAIGAGATHYIEVVAYATSTATSGQSVTFDIAIQWA